MQVDKRRVVIVRDPEAAAERSQRRWEKIDELVVFGERLAQKLDAQDEGMNIRFYIDPETNVPHIYNHDVDEAEVEEVLRNAGEDRPGREGSRVAIGQTRGGRYLRVIYVPDPEPDSIFAITAYELRGKPLAAYRRRHKRKRGTR